MGRILVVVAGLVFAHSSCYGQDFRRVNVLNAFSGPSQIADEIDAYNKGDFK